MKIKQIIVANPSDEPETACMVDCGSGCVSITN